MAEKIGIHKRTLCDWRREKYSIPLDVFRRILKVAKIKTPKGIKIEESFWYVYKGSKMGAKKGALACFKKHGSYGGDPEYRKKKWYERWEKEGKYKTNFIDSFKSFLKPGFLKISLSLQVFFWVMGVLLKIKL